MSMPNLRAAFRTTVSGEGRYEMVFKFPSMDALHKADDEWRALSSRPDALAIGRKLDAEDGGYPVPDAGEAVAKREHWSRQQIVNRVMAAITEHSTSKGKVFAVAAGKAADDILALLEPCFDAHPPAAVAGGQPLRQALIQDAIDNGDHGKVARMALSQPAADAVGTGEQQKLRDWLAAWPAYKCTDVVVEAMRAALSTQPRQPDASTRCYTVEGDHAAREKALTAWVRKAMRFIDLCDADAGGYDDLHSDAEHLTLEGYFLFGADAAFDKWCLADLEHRTLTAFLDRQPDDAVREYRELIAYNIIQGSAGIRAAEHAKDFKTGNWTDALHSADAVISTLVAIGAAQDELRKAVEGIDDDYMTSEAHHPGYVLIPTAKFEQIVAALASAKSPDADGGAQ